MEETTDIDKPIIPAYDVSREKPFSIEFTNKMAEIEKKIRDNFSAAFEKSLGEPVEDKEQDEEPEGDE